MAEALDSPVCESAGIPEDGDQMAWYDLCYERGHIDEATETYDTLKLRLDGRQSECNYC